MPEPWCDAEILLVPALVLIIIIAILCLDEKQFQTKLACMSTRKVTKTVGW